MEAAQKRLGKVNLFNGTNGTGSGYYVAHDSRAMCCSQFVPSARNSQGPRKVKEHLRTAVHFRTWCVGNREKALELFPEVKPLFAEYELTKDAIRPGVSSTTSIEMVGSKLTIVRTTVDASKAKFTIRDGGRKP